MTLFHDLYLRMNRKRFEKTFKPLDIHHRGNYFVSTPSELKGFLKTLPFLGELRSLGHVTLLVPRHLEAILTLLKPDLFDFVFYDKPPLVLTREFTFLKNQLAGKTFSCLIELHEPANRSLPFLIRPDRRIAFYEPSNYPYYNILIKDGSETLRCFFRTRKKDPAKYFKFSALELNRMKKVLGKTRPLLFVNAAEDTTDLAWEGARYLRDRNRPADAELFKILFLCDAYLGPDDALAELARIFNKRMISI